MTADVLKISGNVIGTAVLKPGMERNQLGPALAFENYKLILHHYTVEQENFDVKIFSFLE